MNHPLHYKQHDGLERIEENKTPSQRGKSKQSVVAVAAVASKGSRLSNNPNDISQMTINSHKLDESVKAPGRPPQRIKGLT